MEVIAFVLAAVALFIAHGKQKQIDKLAHRIQSLERGVPPGTAVREHAAEPAPAAPAATDPVAAQPTPDVDEPVEDLVAASTLDEGWVRQSAPPEPEPRSRKARVFDMERVMGVQPPVWGGAIMLLIAGFFLARMAADNGFFTPTLGVIVCAIGALLALAGAFVVRRLQITNYQQISAALASAAIGTLYATAFLSSAAFGLTSLLTGFLLSAGTAALALAIAFIFGRPVLIVGLLGGYLAPFFLLADAPQALVFHLYLAALLIAGAATCIRLGWWSLLTPVVLLHFAWLAAFLYIGAPPDAPELSTLVALVVSPLVLFLLVERGPETTARGWGPTELSTALAMFLVLAGASWTDFSPLYLVGVCALGLGTALMTVFGRSGTLTPTYIAVAGWLLMMASWREPDGPARLVVGLVMLAAIAVPLVVGMLRGRPALRAASVLCVAVTLSFVSTMVDLDGWIGVRDLPTMWAALALLFAAAAVAGALFLGRAVAPEAADGVRGIFSASASGYVSLAIVAVVDPNYFALAAALQVLGLALVQRRYPLQHLPLVAGLYIGVYFGLLALSILAWAEPGSLREIADYVPGSPPWDAPVVALLLPALAFLLAATILRGTPAWLVRVLDNAAVALGAFGLTYLILPEPGQIIPPDTLIWSSLWGNAILLLSLAAVAAGTWLARQGLREAGLVVSLVMLAIIGLAVVLPVYGFWPRWHVPGLPLLNVSLTGIVLPGLLALALAWVMRGVEGTAQWMRWLFAIAGGVLVLTGILVDIRHLFHPDMLQGDSGAIERYTYSAGMLLLAFAALLIGTRLDSQPLRYGSLAIMLATVAKVFLFDIGGLEGLWRVASFVGMGLALLATSWFYGRHVFGSRSKPAEDEAPAAP
ncbi:DUF2339 domain-containing protein [Devosia ginsengisoli]|uniref:DUF2339 domain-containing protein n=1 Tax=Devosia ginsengisoli TaxID=400770 RepID=A0A5B8LV84_9HYPH|nr:DUF2339 domain-containing protein [Devosia ginsengisoli]QDZ11322.1 DUF2339 domain-containing protein [Devosia ginsengisoli]